MICNNNIISDRAAVNGGSDNTESAVGVTGREPATAVAVQPEPNEWEVRTARFEAAKATILESLPLFFGPADVFEVRFLGVPGTGDRRRTHAGWLTLADLDNSAVAALLRLSEFSEAVYFTPNPIRRPTWASGVERGKYPAVSGDKGRPACTDADVTERRWLVIDIDTRRAAGVKHDSATDAEKAAAWAVVEAVRADMAAAGWPAPTVIDSGNGWHLYYRLPVPLPGGKKAADDDQIKRFLALLAAKHNSPAAIVDESVFNPSRIMKLPGTMAKKGPGTGDRPHRPCVVLEKPADSWESMPHNPGDGWFDWSMKSIDPTGELLAKVNKPTTPAAPPATVRTPADVSPDRVIRRAVAYIEKMPPGIQGQKGSNATYAAAVALVNGFALDAGTALALLIQHYNPRCEPPWSAGELEHKVTDAATNPHNNPRGHLLAADAIEAPNLMPPRSPAGPPGGPAGQGDVAGDAYEEATDDNPHVIAREMLARHRTADGLKTLARFCGEFHRWTDRAWKPVGNEDADAAITQACETRLLRTHALARDLFNKGVTEVQPKLGKVTTGMTANVSQALRSLCLVPSDLHLPCWLPGEKDRPPPADLIATAGGLVNLPAYHARTPGAVIPPTPAYFNQNATGYVVPADPDAVGKPVEWLKFLASVWPADPESVALLQEWFGYLLTPDLRHQKMLLIFGPRRAGKGTISYILQQIVGEENCCGPTMSSIADHFGLEDLLGKQVAWIEDARLSPKADGTTVVERLLAISGGGRLTVPRKFNKAVNARLPLRFVMATNELPKLIDSSSALASRWCVLKLTRSFAGQEDIGLLDRLLPELPGIFLWAVEGWARLRRQGRFTEPESSRSTAESITAIGSPVSEFLADRCEVGDGYRVVCGDLYAAWKDWCEQNGRKEPGTTSDFGRLLTAAAPTVERKKSRVGDRTPYCYQGVRVVPNTGRVPDDWPLRGRGESATTNEEGL